MEHGHTQLDFTKGLYKAVFALDLDQYDSFNADTDSRGKINTYDLQDSNVVEFEFLFSNFAQ